MDALQWLGELVGAIAGLVASLVGAVVGALFSFLGAVLDFFAGLVAELLELLPDAADLGLEIPSGWLIGFQTMDAILPLHEALFWFGFMVGLRAAITLWHLAVRLYHLLPKPLMGT